LNALEQTKKTSLKQRTAITMAAIAVVGLGGGYALGSSGALGTPTVNANGMNSNHWNNSHDSGNTAYIIDAAEKYLAAKGTDPNTVQVTKVMTQDEFAFGHFDGTDGSAVFFAQKTDGKWTVVYDGQMITPEAKDSMEKSGFPRNWVESPATVKTDE